MWQTHPSLGSIIDLHQKKYRFNQRFPLDGGHTNEESPIRFYGIDQKHDRRAENKALLCFTTRVEV